MDSRRYELATLAAARRLRSTYCGERPASRVRGVTAGVLAHGAVLADDFLEPDTVRSRITEPRGSTTPRSR